MPYPLVHGIKTHAGVELQHVEDRNPAPVTSESDSYLIPMVQYYTHFALSTEELGHTQRYNCWGFTFLPRRFWINSSDDVDQIIQDNCSSVLPGSLKRGDVIRYKDDSGVTTHTGRVWEVDSFGNCTYVRSKWGGMAEYVHIPLEPYITPYYGTHLDYFRQHDPLKGVIGDLFVKGTPSDNGEQYGETGWTSPDIVVDAPPYGIIDTNPGWSVVNHVWAVVHNRSEAAISNVRVRYYWANPYAGFAASNWQLIPGTPGHPNPTNTFSVPGYSDYTAEFVEWTPTPVSGVPDPAHQCLLAVVYIDDDPTNSYNGDPIVYPFDILWDNNIAARNVHIITLGGGKSKKITINTQVPFDKIDKVIADMRVTMKYVPRLRIFGIPKNIVAPEVKVYMGNQRAVSLTAIKEGIKPMATAVLLPEKVVAMKEFKKLSLIAKKSVPITLEITAPRNAKKGDNFYLNIDQLVGTKVTGGYTIIITIE
jgi:hypothetical protein